LTIERGRKILGDVRRRPGFTKCGQLAALIAVGAALAPGAALASGVTIRPRAAPPVVLDAGFAPAAHGGQGIAPGRLWIRLQPPHGWTPHHYVLEPVAGHAPRGLPWGEPLTAENDLLHVALDVPLDSAAEPVGMRPLVFGFRIRAVVYEHRSRASETIWISFSAIDPVPERRAPRSDQVLFVLLVLGLGFVWYWYKREESAEGKIRLAALVGLISVVFLSVTSAMPWLSVDGDAGIGRISCLLGQEASCLFRSATGATEATDATMPVVAYEVQRWTCASAALRMGQVTALALLLPALVWLLVDPRHRAAQAATAVGASVGGFVLLVAMLYRQSTPSWLDADLYWTSDIALVTSSHIVIAAVLVVRQSFALVAPIEPIPRAQVRNG
jgi:hypothetical protein